MSHHLRSSSEKRVLRVFKQTKADMRREGEKLRRQRLRAKRSRLRKLHRAERHVGNRGRYVEKLAETVHYEKRGEGIWRRAANMLRFLGLGSKVPAAPAEVEPGSDELGRP